MCVDVPIDFVDRSVTYRSTQVFGTLVDRRITVSPYLSHRAALARESPSSSIPLYVRELFVSWDAFAQDWRDEYSRFCSDYSPSSAFITVDEHHLHSLRTLIAKYGLDGLWTDEEMLDISRIWHCLDPWEDSSQGLKRLSSAGFPRCALSNGNISLLQDLATHGSLQFDHLFSAETFKAYKPNPRTYLGAVEKLGLKPEECAMVAAHLGDLDAAKKLGLNTVYIERREEESWPQEQLEQAKAEGWVDVWIGMEHASEGGGVIELTKILKRLHQGGA